MILLLYHAMSNHGEVPSLTSMLTRREYLALFGSFILILLEGLISVITLALRKYCYQRTRTS